MSSSSTLICMREAARTKAQSSNLEASKSVLEVVEQLDTCDQNDSVSSLHIYALPGNKMVCWLFFFFFINLFIALKMTGCIKTEFTKLVNTK